MVTRGLLIIFLLGLCFIPLFAQGTAPIQVIDLNTHMNMLTGSPEIGPLVAPDPAHVVGNAPMNNPLLSMPKTGGSVNTEVKGSNKIIFTSPRIQVDKNSYQYITQWGGTGTANGQFNYPSGVCTDDAGNVYVADNNNNRIQKFSSTGTHLWTRGGVQGSGDLQFSGPNALTVDSKNQVVYVADGGNNRVPYYTSSGLYLGALKTTTSTTYSDPRAIFFDDISKMLYVNQKFLNIDYLRKINPIENSVISSRNVEPLGILGFTGDSSGNIWTSNKNTHAVYKLDTDFKSVLKTIGQENVLGNDNSHFDNPTGLACDESDNVYVGDYYNNRVQKFDSQGTYITTIGSGFGSGDGQLNGAYGVAIGLNGALYVCDAVNNRIQEFKPVIWADSISPSSASAGTEVLFTIKGSNLNVVDSVTMSKEGRTYSATNLKVTSSTITGTFSMSVNPGDYSVELFEGTRKSANTVTFTVNAQLAPVITSINPTTGITGQSVSFTLQGSNFANGAAVRLIKQGSSSITATSVAVLSPTSLTGTFNLQGASEGSWIAIVQQNGLSSNQQPFMVTAVPTPVAPVITAITPSSGLVGQSVSFILQGSNFANGAGVLLLKQGSSSITATSVAVPSPTELTGSFNLQGASEGSWNVIVQQNGLSSNQYPFAVVGAIPTPLITAVSPPSGVTGQSASFAVQGMNFVNGTGVLLLKQGYESINATNVSVVSPMSLTGVFNLLGAAVGSWNVTVQQGGLSSNQYPYTVTSIPVPKPVVTGITPTKYMQTKTVPFTVKGSGFATNAQVSLIVSKKPTIAALKEVATSTTIKGTLTIPFNAQTGARSVAVTQGGKTSVSSTKVVITAIPAKVTSISPSSGKKDTTVITTIRGEYFIDGMGVYLIGDTGSIKASLVQKKDSKTLSAAFVLKNNLKAGSKWSVILKKGLIESNTNIKFIVTR